MRQELGRSDVPVTRFEVDAQATQRVSCGDVPAYVVGVGVALFRFGIQGAADVLNVPVAKEKVARAGAEVEA
ncbi:hypothetical protein ACFVWZ_25615 [Streptomyces sp. NPDC058200]|uniref:hypothetical protein n=1 Tax=Streptomyces sp. NPDC058200 TaxID=3346378 RepID=UPI0036E7368F